ncbi:MAG: hypothetical protein JW917_07380 [Ignavibacteria bacterium]|nr:hypothetical protein [Ignavibacteria bacterium]
MKRIIIGIFSVLLVIFTLQGCDTGDEEIISPLPSERLKYLGGVVTPGDARNVFAGKIGGTDFAFVADGPHGLQIINAGNPRQPFIVSSLNNIGYSYDITVSTINNAKYAFIAASTNGLAVVNVSNPSSPSLTSVVSFTNDAVISVAVNENTKKAYAGTFNGYLYVIDVSVLPAQPVNLGNYDAYDRIKGLAVSGNYCYLAEPGYGIEIINVQNHLNPYNVSFFDTPGDPQDIVISSEYNIAYIADGNAGLTVLDVTNPADPYFCVTKYSYDDVLGVSVNQDYVFTAEFTEGCEAFSIWGDPSEPKRRSYYLTDGYAYGVFARNEIIYIADGFNGLVILSLF